MPGQPIPTWRQVVFATIVLAFLGAGVGTAFGMVRTKSADSARASQRASQPELSSSSSPSPSPSQSSDTPPELVDNQASGGPTNNGDTQTQNDNRCRVPKVIGLHETDARKKLTDCGLTLKEVKYGCDEQTEAGKVTWQSPDGGNLADRGSKFSLLVQGVKVPGVVGKYHADAKSMLEQAGLKVTVNNLQPGAAGGAVSAQNPPGGSCVKAGTTVTITVGTQTSAPPASAAAAG